MLRRTIALLPAALCLLVCATAARGQAVSPIAPRADDATASAAAATATNPEGDASFPAFPQLLASSSVPRSRQGGAPTVAPPQAPEANEQELAKKLANPIASLISVPFQNNFDFDMGESGRGWRYTMNFQPVVPVALNKDWNLISRTIVPYIYQANVVGVGSQTGLGDVTQSFFFSPNKTEPFIWGFGPVLLIPTATDEALGTGKFGLGPTLVVLKQHREWTYGILANQIWSVAGKENRASVNSLFLQPFVSYTTRTAWTYSLNTESSYNWLGNTWSVPIHLEVAKLVRFGHRPVSLGAALRCWATSPEGGPGGCGFRLIMTPLFPKK